MQPFQQRVVDEKRELDEKLQKLMAFFGSDLFNGLSANERELLKEQSEHMESYSVVLRERIALFS